MGGKRVYLRGVSGVPPGLRAPHSIEARARQVPQNTPALRFPRLTTHRVGMSHKALAWVPIVMLIAGCNYRAECRQDEGMVRDVEACKADAHCRLTREDLTQERWARERIERLCKAKA